VAGTKKENLVVSFEGIGSSGKTTQAAMLAGSFWKKYNTAVHKMINRKLLQRALKPLPHGQSEQLWVANLPRVEEGTDMLVFMALMKQRYSEIREGLGKAKSIIILGRYIDSVFAHSATRIVLSQLASEYKTASHSPEELAMLIYQESQKKGMLFEALLDRRIAEAVRLSRSKVEALYKAFFGLRYIMRWPDITIVLDLPISAAHQREIRRENRAFSKGDSLYFAITSKMYKFLERKEPSRIRIVDGNREREEIAKEVLDIVTKKRKLDAYRKHTAR
jgi:thymidylate kinase